MDWRCRAAEEIAAAFMRGERISRLGPDLQAENFTDAYHIQDHVASLIGPVGGWKVGRSSDDGSDTCAPLFADRIYRQDVKASPATLLGTAVELEFAFRIGTDLPVRDQPYSLDDVAAAIDAFVPLVELIGGRFLDRSSLSPAEQLADGYGSGVFIGPMLTDWRNLDFREIEVELWVDGVRQQAARGSHPTGDPIILLAWLANHLMGRPGGGLRRGQIVTTGGLAGVTPVRGGERVEARYRTGADQLLTSLRFDFDR